MKTPKEWQRVKWVSGSDTGEAWEHDTDLSGRPGAWISVPVPKPRGRPQAPHWEGAMVMLAVYVRDHGTPDTQAELERAVQRWLLGNDLDAGESEIRDHVRPLYQALKAGK